MRKSLEEIDEVLYKSPAYAALVRITLMPGLGLEYNRGKKTITITHPKLVFGMPQQTLEGKVAEDGFGMISADEPVDFRTNNGYFFSLKHSQIENCEIVRA